VEQLRRAHLHVANRRRDFHHKTALALVRQYGTVCHEALSIAGIVRGRLAKSALDAGWAAFLSILRHKAEGAGVRVVAVPPYRTSQVCSSCGALPPLPKTLRDRVHRCPCGYVDDRDVNAAKNVLSRGTRPGSGRQDTTGALALVS
jgi:putative transposase